MKNVYALTAFWLCIGPLFAQKNYTPETLAKIRAVENNISGTLLLNDEGPSTIAQRMAKHKVKGMSIAVIQDYKIAWAKGYGWADESEKRPVTTETLFEPGSISKTLNAVGILKLAQDKKIDLNTDINQYLTTWKFPYDSLSKGKPITLAQILSHHAGLSVHGFPGHHNSAIPTVYEVLDGKKPAVTPPVRSEFEPDLQFQYSGGGTTISQVLLTDVTKQAYDVWMYENVLKPIGMVNSSYTQPPAKDKLPLCASGYFSDGTPVLNKFRVYPELAAAGLWMTPSDLCNYIIDIQLAWQGKQPSKVLTPDMVKLHLTPYKDGPAAMGTFIEDLDGTKYFSHSAGNDGFCGFFYASLDEGYGMAVFLNSEAWVFLEEIKNSVAKAYNWKGINYEPQRKTSIEVPESVVKTYEGIYLYDDLWAAIEKKDGQYVFHTRGISASMHFITPTTFFNEEFPAVKTFVKDEYGNIMGYSRTVDGKEFPKSIKIINPDTVHLSNETIGGIGWHLFENKQYPEAIAYFKRGVQLYPEDVNMDVNLAHMYLFSGEYKKAIAIYKARLKEAVRPDYSGADLIKSDLLYFIEHNGDVKVIDSVFSDLKIEKPKGY